MQDLLSNQQNIFFVVIILMMFTLIIVFAYHEKNLKGVILILIGGIFCMPSGAYTKIYFTNPEIPNNIFIALPVLAVGCVMLYRGHRMI